MTEGGTSKKVTVAGVGIAAELALAGTSTPSKLAYFVAVAIAVITLTAIGVQAFLDYKKPKDVT
jgi:hypothetical protein